MKLSETPIYIAHCKSLGTRRQFMQEQLDRYGLTATWIRDYDAVELNNEGLETYYHYDPEEWRRKTSWYGDFPARKLTMPEASLAIKHFVIFSEIAKNDASAAIVLEDDAIFADDFVNRFDEMFATVPDDWDSVFIGSGCNLRCTPPDGSYFSLKSHPATKCTDSFLLTKAAAMKLCSTLTPFVLPIDFELNYQLMHHDLKVYWIEPPLISQGSQNGTFGGSISH